MGKVGRLGLASLLVEVVSRVTRAVVSNMLRLRAKIPPVIPGENTAVYSVMIDGGIGRRKSLDCKRGTSRNTPVYDVVYPLSMGKWDGIL